MDFEIDVQESRTSVASFMLAGNFSIDGSRPVISAIDCSLLMDQFSPNCFYGKQHNNSNCPCSRARSVTKRGWIHRCRSTRGTTFSTSPTPSRSRRTAPNLPCSSSGPTPSRNNYFSYTRIDSIDLFLLIHLSFRRSISYCSMQINYIDLVLSWGRKESRDDAWIYSWANRIINVWHFNRQGKTHQGQRYAAGERNNDISAEANLEFRSRTEQWISERQPHINQRPSFGTFDFFFFQIPSNCVQTSFIL